MSVKASAYRFVMRHFANMNPTRRPDTIGAMQHITETTFNTRLAADLELSQCKTPDDVRYELGSLRGTAPTGGWCCVSTAAHISRGWLISIGTQPQSLAVLSAPRSHFSTMILRRSIATPCSWSRPWRCGMS